MQAYHGGVGCGRTVTLRVQIQVDWVVLFDVIWEASPFLRTSCGVVVIVRQNPVFPVDARIAKVLLLGRHLRVHRFVFLDSTA